MQSPEEFMRCFFVARTAELRRELETRVPFRKSYFTDDCVWDSRAGTVEASEAEDVSEVSRQGAEAIVITDYVRKSDYLHRRRYHLRQEKGIWRIQKGEFECSACRGKEQGLPRNPNCVGCGGTGWVDPMRLRDKVQFWNTPSFRGRRF